MQRILLVIASCIGLLMACQKDPFYVPTSIQHEMDKGIENGFDGMIVYVNKAGKSSFYSAGYKDRKNQILADPHAPFKIASISKLYLAAAVTMLVADDSLSLESTLAELIPELEGQIPNAEKITLRLMIQHRSGIVDYGFEPEVEGETNDDYLSFMARVYDKPASFEPDTKYGYSNSNYLLLGEIMDRTLGYSHHDYIQSEILDPLDLVNTYNVYLDSDTGHVTSGYIKLIDYNFRTWDFPLPGGNMVATAEDVGTFLRALVDGTLLTDDEQEIYTSVYEYGHTGWLPGYCSIARYHSDIDAVVVQFVNTSSNEFYWLQLERVYDRIVTCVQEN